MIIKINGYTLPTEVVGSTFKESLEDELDTLAVVYYDNDKPSYQAHDIAEVDNKKWLVGTLQSDLVARNPIKYRTTLMLIELTKLLERFIIGPCSFTSKRYYDGDSLLQQVDKALDQAEILRNLEYNKFVFSNELLNILNNTPGEEFFFNNSQMTLREVLDKMLAVLNYRVVLEDIDNDGLYHLGFRDLNKQSDDIKAIKGDIVSENVNQNMEYLAGEYETLIRNALSKDRRVMTEEWQTLKPTSIGVADSEGFRLVVSSPIEEIDKIIIRWQASAQDTESNEHFFTVDWNLTELVVEQEIYDTMPLTEQEKHLPFLRGSKEIGVLGTYKKLFISFSKIRSYLIDKAYQYVINYINSLGSNFSATEPMMFPFSIGETSLYEVSYVPYLDLHFSQTKENVELSTKSVMISNQQEETIEVDRYSSSLRALANKLGNKTTGLSVILKNKPIEELKNDMLELGDRIDEDNTLISREYSIFDVPFQPHIKVHYVFIEHYSNVLATKLSRERRLYGIPIENIVERDVLVKEYLILSTAKDLKPDSLLSNEITLPYFLKTFNNANDDNTPVDRLFFATDDGNNTYGYFSLPLLGSAVGKSMHWQTKCFDNYSVGLSTGTQTIGGREVHQNPYVDANGEFKELIFHLIKSRITGLNFPENADYTEYL